MLALSLRKLGWLTPVYATSTGQILSGHQRSFVARELGYDLVPVVFVGVPEKHHKAVNILFNRATNDMYREDSAQSLGEKLEATNIFNLASKFEDKSNFYPCLNNLKNSPLAKLSNNKNWNEYARNVAASLYKHKIILPIIATEKNKIISGIGRLQYALERGLERWPVVFIEEEKEDLASALLNNLSGTFALEHYYHDLLQYNSFRRSRRTREGLGNGFLFAYFDKKKFQANQFDHTDAKQVSRWRQKFGDRILDFGAGHLTETKILKEMGCRTTPFEPYHLGQNNQIDKDKSLAIARNFLGDVEAGKGWDSIFISSVLNSVPFVEDREAIVQIVAACSSTKTRGYAWATSQKRAAYNIDRQPVAQVQRKQIIFALDYEPGIYLGDFSEAPKVQKYHSAKEFYELFKTGFEKVKVLDYTQDVASVFGIPRLDIEKLSKAIKLEFNLPYPDGSRMNLVAEAKAAFSKRLKQEIK